MPDQFAQQFRRYWLIIVTVAGLCSGVFGFQISMLGQLFALRAQVETLATAVQINITRLQQFADQGPRYTLKDHEEYARDQRLITQDHERRLTILENRNGR